MRFHAEVEFPGVFSASLFCTDPAPSQQSMTCTEFSKARSSESSCFTPQCCCRAFGFSHCLIFRTDPAPSQQSVNDALHSTKNVRVKTCILLHSGLSKISVWVTVCFFAVMLSWASISMTCASFCKGCSSESLSFTPQCCCRDSSSSHCLFFHLSRSKLNMSMLRASFYKVNLMQGLCFTALCFVSDLSLSHCLLFCTDPTLC